MKGFILTILISLNLSLCFAQEDFGAAFTNENYADSVLKELPSRAGDTTKVKLLNSLGGYYLFIRQDSSVYFFEQSIELAERINYPYGMYWGYLQMAWVLNTASDYAKSLEMALKSLKLAEKFETNKEVSMAASYSFMASINLRNQNDSLALSQIRQSVQLYKQAGVAVENMAWAPCIVMVSVYSKCNYLDSALFYAKAAYAISLRGDPRQQVYEAISASSLAGAYLKMRKFQPAHDNFLRSMEVTKRYNAPLLRVRTLNNLALFFKTVGQTDSCILYAKMALRLCENHQFGEHATYSASLISGSYESEGKPDSALKYTKIFIAARDTILNQAKLMQVQLLNFDEGQRQKDMQRTIAEAQERYRNQIKYYVLIATAALFLLLAVILYRNNRNKEIANKALEAQKKEIDQQRTKAENALAELRTTQTQLIQSEKMASLGELTAGIAHEIQNPLNFINNFSEINKELLAELKDQMDKGNVDQASNVASNIIENEEKITYHGKRADGIVKGMLQHSRTNTGQKELVDINVLADEYLRLSYHGLKAKDKSFNALIQTEMDERISKVYVVSQDLGRVLLNLFNNAFYAVSEKKQQTGRGYEPTVTLITKKLPSRIEIRIKDNGNGIPQKVLDKIFQPFFTTKPAGKGTGLGLSLSYEIVKASGGELKVETIEGLGAEFIVQIPTT
jgi:two-component system, NtrC family, sensor kinase